MDICAHALHALLHVYALMYVDKDIILHVCMQPIMPACMQPHYLLWLLLAFAALYYTHTIQMGKYVLIICVCMLHATL
jgi:hypothetical protein